MNEKEKSLKLAKLMGWNHKVAPNGLCYGYIPSDGVFGREINPYADTVNGRSQFAAIMLHDKAEAKYIISVMHAEDVEFTQEHFLDMKLIENGVDIDE